MNKPRKILPKCYFPCILIIACITHVSFGQPAKEGTSISKTISLENTEKLPAKMSRLQVKELNKQFFQKMEDTKQLTTEVKTAVLDIQKISDKERSAITTSIDTKTEAIKTAIRTNTDPAEIFKQLDDLKKANEALKIQLDKERKQKNELIDELKKRLEENEKYALTVVSRNVSKADSYFSTIMVTIPSTGAGILTTIITILQILKLKKENELLNKKIEEKG